MESQQAAGAAAGAAADISSMNSSHVSNSPSNCSLCGGQRRTNQKKRKNCPGRYRRDISDEPHWSKLLQTCQLPPNASPTMTSSPPVSPLASFGNSVSKFFRWITPSKRSARRNSIEESDHPTSASSDGSCTCPESPVPRFFYESSSSKVAEARVTMVTRSAAVTIDTKPTNLQSPSTSTLMAKRYNEKHKVKKPIPVLQANVNRNDSSEELYLVSMRPLAPITNNQIEIPSAVDLLTVSTSNGHSPLTVALSCPTPHNKSNQAPESKGHFADTWPPCNYHINYADDDEHDSKDREDASQKEKSRNVQDFKIPFKDIQKDECMGVWRYGCVYHGRWHGSVVIMTYDCEDEKVTKEFWEEVKTMSRIRHENIVLFMGACVEPRNRALVTSECSGTPLFEKLHVTRSRLPLAMRINIAYEIAQALAYLHAKKIVYKKLNSKNIFIEKQKATLSVIDFNSVYKNRESESGLGTLPYLAPELIKQLVVESQISLSYVPTSQSDIYAYGVLLHELISGSKPYKDISRELLVLQVLNGRRPVTENLTCPQSIKMVIEKCCKESPHERLYAHELLKLLQNKDVALHNRFSSSAPENINKVIPNLCF